MLDVQIKRRDNDLPVGGVDGLDKVGTGTLVLQIVRTDHPGKILLPVHPHDLPARIVQKTNLVVHPPDTAQTFQESSEQRLTKFRVRTQRVLCPTYVGHEQGIHGMDSQICLNHPLFLADDVAFTHLEPLGTQIFLGSQSHDHGNDGHQNEGNEMEHEITEKMKFAMSVHTYRFLNVTH